MRTLFSIMNGDSILDTFKALSITAPYLGAIFLYSFICLFMYVVLNVFIAIIEEAFFATRTSIRVLENMSSSAVRIIVVYMCTIFCLHFCRI